MRKQVTNSSWDELKKSEERCLHSNQTSQRWIYFLHGMRECNKCHTLKTLSSFYSYKKRNARGIRLKTCIVCCRQIEKDKNLKVNKVLKWTYISKKDVMGRIYRSKDHTNRKYGKLLAISYDNSSKQGTNWKFRCDCGKEVIKNATKVENGSISSCGCLHKEQLRAQIAKRELNRKIKPDCCEKRVYSQYLRGSRLRGIAFTLSFEEFVDICQKNCHYCNSEPKMTSYYSKKRNHIFWKYNGIDRYDNDKDYVFDNCVPCCTNCNFMKQDKKVEDFLEQVEKIVKWSKEKCK